MKLTSPDEDKAFRLTIAGAAMAPASTTPLFSRERRATPWFASGERKSAVMPLTSRFCRHRLGGGVQIEPGPILQRGSPDGKRLLRHRDRRPELLRPAWAGPRRVT